MSDTLAVILTVVATVVLVLVPVLLWRLARRIAITPGVLLALVFITLLPKTAWPPMKAPDITDLWRRAFLAGVPESDDDE